MCGIVGYIGNCQAQDILLDGLARLEYRGYDSTGIAVMENGAIHCCKANGRLNNLVERVTATPLSGHIGIGHTRWATHGEPSEINAHPHMDTDHRIAIVHNGIIENHDSLRTMLQHKGCVFVSGTDSEVVAHLLSTLYNGDMASTLAKAQDMLEGSYALAVLSATEPDALFCTCKDSPLAIGLADGEQFIASDIPALIPHARKAVVLNDREIAVLTCNHVRVFNSFGIERPPVPIHVDWDVEAAEKGGYAHFMLKEIHEEPQALQKTFTAHVDPASLTFRPEAFPITASEARSITRLTIAACGTAFHAGVVGKYVIENLARLPVTVEVASEFRYRNPVMGPGDLFLAISQSGETADTLAAMREASRLGAKVMALTNVLGSSITREAGVNVMYTCAGPEIAVASTKAYITQVETMLLLAADLALKRGEMSGAEVSSFLHEMADIPCKVQRLLECESAVKYFARRHSVRQEFFFIGRGIDYALALEASLKLKEVSYIMSEAYAAGELKHGTIALIEEGTPVCALMSQILLADKMLSNIHEVRSRGARTLLICPESICEKAAGEADDLWPIPDTRPELMPLLAVIPVQLLSYHMAVTRGCDADKPRNLAKSVTVE